MVLCKWILRQFQCFFSSEVLKRGVRLPEDLLFLNDFKRFFSYTLEFNPVFLHICQFFSFHCMLWHILVC
ncbi:hypothetical protein pah_c026o050 [Parachlamydia acanthamoebae str. Hall's coccus]|nr:hypothetical protein pah_c026o050 [Parachlamydia acanthamoebae str. Hall's coccus]